MPAVDGPASPPADGLYDASSEAEGNGGASHSSDSPRHSDPTSPQLNSLGSPKSAATTDSSDGSPPPAYTSSDPDVEKGQCPHQEAYHAQQEAAADNTTFELDGQPLPDIDHPYYDKYHEPESDHGPSHDLKDSYKSLENFRSFLSHNHYFHLSIAILIVIDVLIVIIELILDLEIARNHLCAHDHDCPHIEVHSMNISGETLYNCSFDSHHTSCLYKSGGLGCYDPHDHEEHNPVDVLHYMSIAVLACFVLETLVRVVVLQKEFFKRKLDVFDGIIVTVAFILDLTVDHGSAVALLLLVRLWRISRIVNGFAIAVESREAAIRLSLRQKTRAAGQELLRKKETVHLLRAELIEWKKAASLVTDAVASGLIGVIDEASEHELDTQALAQAASECFTAAVTRPM